MKYFTIKKKISSEEVDDIMHSALRGITYWADEAKVLMRNFKEEDDGILTSDALSKGYSVKIHDSQEDKWLTLNMNKFLKGLEMMEKHDYYEYDQLDCDMIVQYSLFGEIKYS